MAVLVPVDRHSAGPHWKELGAKDVHMLRNLRTQEAVKPRAGWGTKAPRQPNPVSRNAETQATFSGLLPVRWTKPVLPPLLHYTSAL